MLPVSRVIGHKEWAPGRKSDPTYDMNWRRTGVATVQPRSQEDDMFTDDDRRLLRQLNDNLTWSRDQICAGIGVDKDAPPPKLTPDALKGRVPARGVDLTWVRNQLATALGFDPEGAPEKLTPEQIEERAPLRRSDLENLTAEIVAQVVAALRPEPAPAEGAAVTGGQA